MVSGEANGYFLNSNYYFLGKTDSSLWIRRVLEPTAVPEAQTRSIRKECPITLEDERVIMRIMSMCSLKGGIGHLHHRLEHHAYPTVFTWVEKHNRYAVWEAAMFNRFLTQPVPAGIGRGKQVKRWLKRIYLRLPMRPAIRFMYSYFLRLGFLDGKPNFSIFCSSSFLPFTISLLGPTCTSSKSQIQIPPDSL